MHYAFNTWIDTMKPSASVIQMEKAKAMIAQGADIVNLAGGEPNFDTPAPVTYRAIRELVNGNTHYVTGAGLPILRERIAQYLKDKDGISCGMDQILVTPGGKFAIYLAACVLLNPGDEVLIPEPSWVSYSSIVHAIGAVPVPVPLRFEDNYAMTRQVLEEKITEKTKLMIINSPNNPTGRMLTQDEAEMLMQLAQDRNLMIISDEIYSELVYDRNRHISLASLPHGMDHVVTVDGFSKFAAMTGWRLGFLCAHMEIMKRILKLYQHTMTCVSGFSQQAALQAFECREDFAAMLKAYTARRSAFIGALQRIDGVDARFPEGAFYAWVRIHKNNFDALTLCDYLLNEAGVAGVPGTAFGGGGERCVRFSFASSMEELEKAAERISRAVKKL